MKRDVVADHGGSDRAIISHSRQPMSVEELVHHLHSGRTVTGEPIKPYKWLDFAGGERSPMELRVSRVMESCSFKSALSCVLGVNSPFLQYIPLLLSSHVAQGLVWVEHLVCSCQVLTHLLPRRR